MNATCDRSGRQIGASILILAGVVAIASPRPREWIQVAGLRPIVWIGIVLVATGAWLYLAALRTRSSA